jgi:hypothetical protein
LQIIAVVEVGIKRILDSVEEQPPRRGRGTFRIHLKPVEVRLLRDIRAILIGVLLRWLLHCTSEDAEAVDGN